MYGNSVDVNDSNSDSDNWYDGSNDDDEDSTDHGIFDDADEEGTISATTRAEISSKKDQTHRKRKIHSPRNTFFDLRRAIKRRRRRREELKRQHDPEQFDDNEDPNPNPNSGCSTEAAASDSAVLAFDKPQAVHKEVDDEDENKITANTSNAEEISRDTSDGKEHIDKIPHIQRTRNHNNFFKFDERKFFSSPTFKPQVKEEAFRRIYAAIEAPLKALEEDGYEAYRQYIDENNFDDNDNNDAGSGKRNRKSYRGPFRKIKHRISYRNKEKRREDSIRNALRNALVNGDPREYQRTIFEVAKQRNTIVNLGTGAGKTLIALLLIREVWSLESSSSSEEKEMIEKSNERKQTLFLVPSVALAIQQSLTLRANLPNLCVETACYASASSKRARASLGRCDVIVATHGVIQDLLMHYGDTFRMDRFNLVVIDECHYAASGNHSYRHLMKKFYHTLEPQKRPRVLGLTASPLLNVKESHSNEQLSTMLDNLERTLDSKMVSATGLMALQEKDEAANSDAPQKPTVNNNDFLHRVIDERALNYRGTNTSRTIPPAANLDLLPSRYREFKQLEHLYKDVGPLVVKIYCSVIRRELSKNIFENESVLQFDGAINHLQRIEEFCNQEIKILPNMGRNDKMLALEELIETLIEEKGGTKTIGLVFVERRITAIALHCYFLWRNKRILDGNSVGFGDDWKFAKQARRDARISDQFFELKCSKSNEVHESGREDYQFDDSADDPFHVFQKGNETQDEVAASFMGLQNEIHANNLDLVHKAQFMDAESDSEEEINSATRGYTKKGLRKRLGRVLVKSVALVRNPVQIFNSLSMTQKNFKESEKEEQRKNWVHRELNVREVLHNLRRGDMNLMFATSVVEEGVDVQACSFVVAFDGLTNIKGYIQMKGRARKRDAKFFVFRDTHDSRESNLELCVAQRMEHRIQRFIEERMRIYAPRILDMSSNDRTLASTIALPKEIAAVEAGMYKVGDATVDVQSAKALLNRYFLSIPLDPFVRCKKESLLAYMPCFESNKLVLPVHLPNDIRTVVLPERYVDFPRREKQKFLSLMACVRLHCHGLLSERLLPLGRKDMQSRILQGVTQKLEKVQAVSLDLDCFYNSNRRHFVVYPFNQESQLLSQYSDSLNGEGRTLGLITTAPIRPIEPFQLHHAEFGKVEISVGEAFVVSCSKSEFDILQKILLLLINSRWSRKSRNIFYETRTKDQYDAVIPPYLVGILSSGSELDWDFMNELVGESNRSIEERTSAARNYSPSVQLTKPRICCSSYNEFVPYVVFGPTGESCGARIPHENEDVNTYCEYFEKFHSLRLSTDCPLFRVHRIWSLPSGLPTKPRSKETGRNSDNSTTDSVEIPQQAFIEEPLANAHIALLCLFLPQVLFAFERQQKTEAFIEHCEAHIPTLGSCFRKMKFSRVALAVTAKSCNPDENYDGWEWVGDAVLKLLQTDSILKSAKFKHFVRFLHEGDLSMLRSGKSHKSPSVQYVSNFISNIACLRAAMGTNERLRQVNILS